MNISHILDLTTIPFSRYGSYFAISQKDDKIYLRDLHGGDESPFEIFELEFIYNDEKVTPTITFTQTMLTFSYNENTVKIVFGTSTTVNILCEGLTLKLHALKNRYDSLIYHKPDCWLYELYTKEIKVMLTKLSGSINVDAPWNSVGNHYIDILLSDDAYLVLESFRTVNPTPTLVDFNTAFQTVTDDFNNYNNTFDYSNNTYNDQLALAIYITWSCIVDASGALPYPAMYMSKNWMNNIWSWDNCFNAMMLKDSFLDLSLNQFEIFAEHQDTYGQYPDFINDKFKSFNCVKPPIHAFAFKKLLAKNPDTQRATAIFHSIVDSTYFWLNYRGAQSKYPVYYHGNDSGWDNASVFLKGLPVMSPDLTAYLIRQLDILSDIALQLNLPDDSKKLKEEADKLFSNFLEDFTVDNQFVAKKLETNETLNRGSLILYLPIVIAYRFDKDFADKLVSDMLSQHEGTYGLATEALDSPLYEYNGYWLGPIWAPTTYIIIDALRENGYYEDAKRLATKFCDLTTIGKMAENFDPLTGEGLVDKAFTWTSSVFILLKKEFNL